MANPVNVFSTPGMVLPWSTSIGMVVLSWAREVSTCQRWRYSSASSATGETAVRIPTLVAATPAEATRQTEALMTLARRYYAGRVGIGSTDAGSASPEATEEVNLFGTPEDVVDRIEMLREDFSTDEIMFEVNWTSSVPRDVVMKTMRLLTDKVIPQFK
jgi:alkanesulfonate monooxygenase SsuD/methylene tetrahydromethanopterin reductase-like flavin-dependent oxidoreductase (luciferase family)